MGNTEETRTGPHIVYLHKEGWAGCPPDSRRDAGATATPLARLGGKSSFEFRVSSFESEPSAQNKPPAAVARLRPAFFLSLFSSEQGKVKNSRENALTADGG